LYAIIEVGAKQYKVSPGDCIRVERLDIAPGQAFESPKVLLFADGPEVAVGRPHLDNARVEGVVVGHGRARKITIFKFKRRKGYKKKQGHRQGYTTLRITKIETKRG
jgi:large subunit ribosomal protein L21